MHVIVFHGVGVRLECCFLCGCVVRWAELDRTPAVGLARRVDIGVEAWQASVREKRRNKTKVWWAATSKKSCGQVQADKPAETRLMGENGEGGAEV
jgi:hypothetical protein